MKKIKSPLYGLIWIVIWTVALGWFLFLGTFNTRETAGLVIVWGIMVGVTVYLIVKQQLSPAAKAAEKARANKPVVPALNAPCPCGSGKKYKRCCGAT